MFSIFACEIYPRLINNWLQPLTQQAEVILRFFIESGNNRKIKQGLGSATMLLGPNTKDFGPAEFQNMDCADLSQVNGAKSFSENGTRAQIYVRLCAFRVESHKI